MQLGRGFDLDAVMGRLIQAVDVSDGETCRPITVVGEI
jgi:hypothetical protein